MSLHSLIPQTGGGADATKLPLAGGTLTGLLNFSGTTHAGIRLNSLTTVQRDALTAGAGDFLFNSTLSQFQGYTGAAWQSMAGLTSNTFTGQQILSTAGAASTPPLTLTGAFFTGGSATTTKPQFLIEPTGTTSTGWNTSGTGLGVNAASGFAGNLVDFRSNGTSLFAVNTSGSVGWTAGGNTMLLPNFGGAGRLRLGGVNGVFINPGTEFTLGSTTTFGWSPTANGAGNNGIDLYLVRAGAAMLQMGLDAAGVTNQHFKACNRITSDGVGANLTISGGNGRGGAGGSLILATYDTQGANTQGNLQTRLTLNTAGILAFSEAVDMSFGVTTGTKLGTTISDKLAFWNKTPIVQPTPSISAASFTQNTSGIADDSATYGGYTIGQIAAALIDVGILA